MSELKRKILNVLAWIALMVGVVMVVWRVFGDSPTDLQVVSPFLVFGLVKVWGNNNSIKDVGYEVRLLANNTKHGFEKVREDITKLNGGKK